MDTQLVIRAQEGDENAFADLTIAVGGQLHRAAYGILRDRGLAEDATHAAGCPACSRPRRACR